MSKTVKTPEEVEQMKSQLKKGTGATSLLPVVFTPPAEGGAELPNLEGFEQRGLPPIIKPASMLVGQFLRAVVAEVVPSSQKSIKNPLLYLDCLHPDGTPMKTRVAFPLVATLASAFGVRPNEDLGEQELLKRLNAYRGTEVLIKKVGQAAAKKGQKKGAHLFQVLMRNSPEQRAAEGAKKH